MIRVALLVALLGGCSNDAIQYARTLDPSAECAADCTYSGCGRVNTAYCRFGGKSWYCVASNGPHRARCEVLPESPPLSLELSK